MPEQLNFEESRATTTADNPPVIIPKELSVLQQRSNIYDNDEFDVFNQNNVDLSRIHRGKKFVIFDVVT